LACSGLTKLIIFIVILDRQMQKIIKIECLTSFELKPFNQLSINNLNWTFLVSNFFDSLNTFFYDHVYHQLVDKWLYYAMYNILVTITYYFWVSSLRNGKSSTYLKLNRFRCLERFWMLLWGRTIPWNFTSKYIKSFPVTNMQEYSR